MKLFPEGHRITRIILVLISSALIFTAVFTLWGEYYPWTAPLLAVGLAIRLVAYFFPDRWFSFIGHKLRPSSF